MGQYEEDETIVRIWRQKSYFRKVLGLSPSWQNTALVTVTVNGIAKSSGMGSAVKEDEFCFPEP